METLVYITGRAAKVYISRLDRVGFIEGAIAESIFIEEVTGSLGVIFSNRRPLYLYECQDMLWVSARSLDLLGPLMAFWAPEKVTA